MGDRRSSLPETRTPPLPKDQIFYCYMFHLSYLLYRFFHHFPVQEMMADTLDLLVVLVALSNNGDHIPGSA